MKNKKIRRIVAALCLMCLFLISLTACGGSDSGEKQENKEAKEESVAEKEAEQTEEKGEEVSEETDEEAAEETEEEKSSVADPSNFNQVIVETDTVKFEITGIDPKDMWGYTVSAVLENNTDKTLMFAIDEASVNGVMMDPFWASEIAPGKKGNESISWMSSSLKEAGINPEDVSVIEFKLRVYDSEDYMADALVDDVFTIYPLGEENATTAERVDSESDIVLFDNDQCKMVITGYDPDDLFGYTVKAHLINKTDATLMFAIEEASVNGFMSDPFWASSVAGGKSSNEDITWMSLEDDGITEVEEIEFRLHVYDEDSWGDYIVDETFTLKP